MAQKPYQSCLIPYEKEIVALRRNKPPMSYAQIAELLMEKYSLSIQPPAIFKFVKVRSKGYRTCKYAWGIEPANNQTGTPSLQKQTASKPKVSAVENKPKPKASSFDPSKVKITEYSTTWNLSRPNTEEEREAYRQYLREEKRKLEQQ